MKKDNNYKIPKLYVLKDPTTEEIRYVGITIRSLQERLSGHMSDIKSRPELNPHKTNWINKLLSEGKLPEISLVAEYDTIEEAKSAEIEYISKYKEEYKLINYTIGGDHPGERAHSRETILKKKNTRKVDQYNVFGELLRTFDITEDAARFLNINSASKITACCKGDRHHAHGYIWRYHGEPLGDISNIDVYSLCFNYLVQYSLEGKFIKLFTSYIEASKEVGDGSKGGNIASACKGIQRQCKGFLWRLEPKFEYLDESKLDTYVEKDVKIKEKKPTKGIGINKCDLEGNLLSTYISISEASRDTFGNPHRRNQILKCCNGEAQEYSGYKWEYCPAEE